MSTKKLQILGNLGGSFVSVVKKDISLPTSANWQSMAYGNGTFVAIADGSNKVVYSKNGVIWYDAALPFSLGSLHNSIAYGNGKFVVISYSSNVAAYSADGATWSQTTLPTSLCTSVIFAKDKFVAVCINSNSIIQSTDGITWTSSDSNKGYHSDDVAYGSGKFVAVGTGSSGSYVSYSSDLSAWTYVDLSDDVGDGCIAYGHGKFVIFVENSQYAHYSTDGVTWYRTTLPVSASWSDVVYGNGRFIAIASSDGTAVYSEDGVTWRNLELPTPTQFIESNVSYWSSVVYGGNRFVIMGYNSLDVIYSTDGVSWSKQYSMFEQDGQNVGKIEINPKLFSVSYSENETFTGNTWINGKPIYTKTLVKTGAAGNGTSHSLDLPAGVELAWLDTANSFHVNDNGICFAPGALVGSNLCFIVLMNTTAVSFATNLSTGGDFYIRVFYTKTTDSESCATLLTSDGSAFLDADGNIFLVEVN